MSISINLNNLFVNPSVGNLDLQSTNQEVWYVFGKAAAGASVNNLTTDYVGATRGTAFGFANTIGSIQLNANPTMIPPAAIASANPIANTTVNYTFASRNVATINWGSSSPTSASLLNFTGITPANQPSGNNANQYLRVDISGGTAPYNYDVVYNYDPALLGAISTTNNLKVSTQTTGSTITSPVWFTQPINSVNNSALTVGVSGLTTSLANIYLTVTENNAPPVVTRFVPSAGPVGANVSIFGRNFTGTTALNFFNGVSQSTFTVVNDTTITTTIPVGATTGVLSATNANGTGTSTAQLTVIQVPTVTSFSPSAGTFGTVVSILGTNFSTATQVQFNGINATSFTIINSTNITAIAPSNSLATGNITVINPAGSGVSLNTFTIYGVPTISSFTPSSGAVGTLVTINGSNFNAISNVRFNGVNTSFTVNSSTSISAFVPTGATTGLVTIVNGSGTGTSGTNFTVLQLPTITTFSPSSGGVGTSVVINGTNFTGASAVSFNGTPASSFVVNSSTQITAVVAIGSSTGLIAITTPSGSINSAGNNFTVISDLIVSTNVAVSGTYNNITVTSTGTANLIGTLTALGNVTVQTGGKVNFGTEILNGNGNFTTQSGTRLIVGSPVGISATGGISGNIQVAGVRTYSSSAYVEYNGSVAQIAGEGLTNIDTLVINNASGVNLNFGLLVNNRLTFTAGNLLLSNNSLTLSVNATVAGSSAANYVVTNGSGLLRRTIQNNATNVVYPIGTTSYTPVSIQLSNASTTDIIGVSVFNGVYSTGIFSGSNINSNVVNRTWFINEALAGGSIATVQLAWDDSLEAFGFNRANCAIARHNGTSYVTSGTTPFGAAGLVSGQRTRSLSNITNFGNFAIGDAISSLPVKLLSFTANLADNEDDVLLNWTTGSEINNKGFELEHSINGVDFEKIGFVKGALNSTKINSYLFTDKAAFMNLNSSIVYYRLKQIDIDGKFEYSSIIKINNSAELSFLEAYPNPFENNFNIKFNAKSEGLVNIEITNIQGKNVNSMLSTVVKGTNTINLDDNINLKVGIYFVRITLNGESQVVKIVKSNN
ncbi:MAG: IPT/TIG domain-containing protein [Candidatus Methylacidiphilales bacterium]